MTFKVNGKGKYQTLINSGASDSFISCSLVTAVDCKTVHTEDGVWISILPLCSLNVWEFLDWEYHLVGEEECSLTPDVPPGGYCRGSNMMHQLFTDY